MNKKVVAAAAVVVVFTVTLAVLSVSPLLLPFTYKAEAQLSNRSSRNNNNTSNSLNTTDTTTGLQASANIKG